MSRATFLMLPEPPEPRVDYRDVLDPEALPPPIEFLDQPKLIDRLIDVMKTGDGTVTDMSHLLG